jgi:hypothetical protein
MKTTIAIGRKGKIQAAKTRIGSVVSTFTKGITEIELANSVLLKAKQEALKEKQKMLGKIAAIDDEANNIVTEITYNNELKQKLAMFLPTKTK